MIKLTRINSTNLNAPKLFIIPGGPGLSSLTLRSLDILNRSFELIYLDFPGTNDNPYTGKKSFSELSTELSNLIQHESGIKYILGHSFGGFLAADAMINRLVSGLVCISTPFSQQSLFEVNNNYSEKMTPELLQAESNWLVNGDDLSFSKWLAEYGNLYFKISSGKELILGDKVSSLFFKDNRSDALNKDLMLPFLQKTKKRKIFICGTNDELLPPNILKKDAELGGFDFFEIDNASHFVTYDQPEKVASLIEEQLLRP